MNTEIVCLFLLAILPYPNIRCSRPCIPNTQFLLNGKNCFCNAVGEMNESNCVPAERSHICTPGQVIWQGCMRCICRDNGELDCIEKECDDTDRNYVRSTNPVYYWCTPFNSYFVNCSLCICPASGRFVDTRCAKDVSCSLQQTPNISSISKDKLPCIPKVMYLYPCLHCICSESGFFDAEKCLEICHSSQSDANKFCKANMHYRKDCNICYCPSNGVIDENLCTRAKCEPETKFQNLSVLINKSFACKPHQFMQKRCIYCTCGATGTIDENSCLELGCLNDYKADSLRKVCMKEEIVPMCMECLCLQTGYSDTKYCSKSCSLESKLGVLEDIVKDNEINGGLIDINSIKKDPMSKNCSPNSIYMEQGKICICPVNGYYDFNFCSFKKESARSHIKIESKVEINYTVPCVPNTFVTFGCNTCFCKRNGKIDQNWCTYDDCEAKKITQESLAESNFKNPEAEISQNCFPGSISKADCNFCICPDSGYTKDRACTKNDCRSSPHPTGNDRFVCEPLAYYEVDCNVCFCPRDGLKNVARCTKNHCEKSFLRSDVCVPGHLFSDDCNVCVCPPNGKKSDKACTNYTCTYTASWKKIYQLSEELSANQVSEDETRTLELCFPGEEFTVGCKLCVCPDMGLKMYALCSQMFCDDLQETFVNEGNGTVLNSNKISQAPTIKRTVQEHCGVHNITNSTGKENCSPGSLYITGCRQCLCPFDKMPSQFCRELPKDYCETKISLNSSLLATNTSVKVSGTTSKLAQNTQSLSPTTVLHEHSKHKCKNSGKYMDECYICDCEEISKVLIEEHCFKSDTNNCIHASPTFLDDE